MFFGFINSGGQSNEQYFYNFWRLDTFIMDVDMFYPDICTTINIMLQSKEKGSKVDTIVFSFIWCIPWCSGIYWFVWNIISGCNFRK